MWRSARLCGALKQVAPLIAPWAEAIAAYSRQAGHVHADETSWQVFEDIDGKEGHRWWLWTFVTGQTTVFVMDTSRSADVAAGQLGIDREQAALAAGRRLVISSDFHKAHQSLARRGLMTRRQGGTMRSRMAPLVRVPRTLPRILSPEEADRLVAALRRHRDRVMVLGMLLAGLRRCEVLGLRLEHVQVADRRLVVVEGKGGHHRVVPAANRFFDELGAYLHDERPATAVTGKVFVVLKGPRRGLPLSAEGLDEILEGARRRAGLDHGTCHELRHTCLTRLREAGMALEAVQAQAGHRSIESTRVYLHLANDWLAGQYLAAAALIDADTAAVAQMLAVQEAAAR
jgi:integrase